jgi:2-polyprenyl-3-methyl-5-hydroxy-6-metoxy-1,4-benzoquinol methylase
MFGTDATAHLARCNECGLIRTDPQPRGEALAAYYAVDAYYTHACDGGVLKRLTRRLQVSGPLAALRLWAEERTSLSRYTMRFAPRWFGPFRGRLLDYGCGDGQVASTFAAVGMQVFGVEPDPKARDVAAARGIAIYATLEECDAGDFDRIVIRHVLEHIEEPVDALRRLAGRLRRDGGRVLISVPNASSYQALLFDEDWIGWDIPRHLWHFSRETLMRMVEEAGLRVHQCFSVELKPFAAASAARSARAHQKRPAYAPGPVSALEAANGGSELVLVAGRE